MSKNFTTIIEKDTLTQGLKDFFEKAGIKDTLVVNKESADFKARQKLGLQLINFINNGSANEPVVPPIMFGILRASGSVFVDNILVGDTKALNADGTPATEYNEAKPGDVTVGFNTAYAHRLHETTWTPGGKNPSKQAQNNPGMLSDVGNKFVEKHLSSDRESLMALYAAEFKKVMGT
jgi:hypothetical protein